MDLSILMVWIGIGLILHAGYSAVHYKELLIAAGLESTEGFLSMDIKAETCIGLVLSMLAAIVCVGEFRTVDGSSISNKAKWESFWDKPGFRVYNHRAKALQQRLNNKSVK